LGNAAEILDPFGELAASLSPFDTVQVLSFLSGLHARPENQSNLLRLDTATLAACHNLSKPGRAKFSPRDLKRVLNQYLGHSSDQAYLEDPPENLFTENLMYHGGNYVVYPGIDEGGSFGLQLLLDSISRERDSEISELSMRVRPACLTVLSLSNRVAKYLGHKRNYVGSGEKHWEIPIPSESELVRHGNAVTIPDMELEILLRNTGIEADEFESFFITPVKLGERLNYSIERHPLLISPILGLNDGILLLSVAALCGALRNYIWTKAKELGVDDTLAVVLSETQWQEVRKVAMCMNYQEIDENELAPIPPWRASNPFLREQNFLIDSDKIAVVHFITDGGSPYSPGNPFESVDLDTAGKELDRRFREIESTLRPDSRKLFFITCIGSSGRGIRFLAAGPERSPFLSLNLRELSLLPVAELKLNNLTLWKIARLRQRVKHSTEIFCWSFLDLIGFYKQRKESLYAGDEAKPSHIWIASDFCKELIAKSLAGIDRHLVYHPEKDKLIAVCKAYSDVNCPIYFPDVLIPDVTSHVVLFDSIPVWVTFEEDEGEVENFLRHAVVDSISYWIWQLQPHIETHFTTCGIDGLNFVVSVQEPEKWLSSANCEDFYDGPEVTYEIFDSTIHFRLGVAVCALSYKSNNVADRILVREILRAMNDFASKQSDVFLFPDSGVQSVVDDIAPLGLKKKLLALNPNRNIALAPVRNARLRLLSQHDLQETLDFIPSKLDPDELSEREIVEQIEVKKLCHKLVKLASDEIRNILDQCDADALLRRFLVQNEAVIHKREFSDYTRPFTSCCYDGFDRTLETLLLKAPEGIATIIAYRALIEIVAAEPPHGETYPSDEILDQLVALTDYMLLYARVADEVHLNLTTRTLAILPSGRIGLDRDGQVGFSMDFLLEHFREEEYTRISKLTEGSTVPDNIKTLIDSAEFQDAFIAEFGVTKEQFFLFFRTVSSIPIIQSKDIGVFQYEEFVALIFSLAPDLTPELISILIEQFSLTSRKQWAPEPGKPTREILPNRFNRKESLIAKPFVVRRNVTGGKNIYFGARQVEMSGVHCFGSIMRGCYRERSTEMKTIQGKIGNILGRNFAERVYEWLCTQRELNDTVLRNIEIGPDLHLQCDRNLGDIDVLYYDSASNTLYSIECKSVSMARECHELRNELEQFDENIESSDIAKHIVRHCWLKSHPDELGIMLGRNLSTCPVISVIVTSEEIPSIYVRESTVPIVSFSRLSRKGVAFLLDKAR